mmetsp:Transcript_7363/g.30491  ORF Transcript_7363/g.30491 Transcript_7363/m.30491 type:complete len:205 (+) Transcript_7363:498-1112(+)
MASSRRASPTASRVPRASASPQRARRASRAAGAPARGSSSRPWSCTARVSRAISCSRRRRPSSSPPPTTTRPRPPRGVAALGAMMTSSSFVVRGAAPRRDGVLLPSWPLLRRSRARPPLATARLPDRPPPVSRRMMMTTTTTLTRVPGSSFCNFESTAARIIPTVPTHEVRRPTDQTAAGGLALWPLPVGVISPLVYILESYER